MQYAHRLPHSLSSYVTVLFSYIHTQGILGQADFKQDTTVKALLSALYVQSIRALGNT